MLRKLFLDHPEEVGESYGEHFKVAASYGWPMILGGIACLVHGLVPGLFRNAGSATIRDLNARLCACPHRAARYRDAQGVPAE